MLAETEGIRTLDRALQPYNGLANRRLQPLGHISGTMHHMPDPGRMARRQARLAAWLSPLKPSRRPGR